MNRIVPAVCLSIALSAVSGTAFGATLTREAVERKVLDACVYRQFSVKEIDRNRMIDNCRCATKATMATLPGDEIEVTRSGDLTGPQNKALQAAIATCFK